MQHVILLGLANAGSLAVQLLAIVLVIVTRPQPKPLLWAFYLTALVVSCVISGIVLALFRADSTFLGSTSRSVNPVIYLIVGVIALATAAFAATTRGRELIGHEIDRQASAARKVDSAHENTLADRAGAKVKVVKGKAEEALRSGSVWVAIGAGVFMAAPSPFSLAAVGWLVHDGYSLPVQLLLILVFALLSYLVVEIPVVSFLISPNGSAARLNTFSTWLETHKIQAVAALAAVVGLVLIVKGLTAL